MRKIVVSAIVGCLILATLHFQPVKAADCYVPSAGYATIGAAVADNNCTTIYVAAGTYNENMSISRDLTLIGAGASTTTIDGVSGNVIEVHDATVNISGFTITGGEEGLHYDEDAFGTIENNVITGNSSDGISVDDYSDPTIKNNTISENGASGIGVDDGSDPTIRSNTIQNNDGDGIECDEGSDATIEANIITGNEVGIWVDDESDPDIINNYIFSNESDGIECEDYSFPVIYFNTIVGNGEEGIDLWDSEPDIIDNIIASNGGDGIYYEMEGAFAPLLATNETHHEEDDDNDFKMQQETISRVAKDGYGIAYNDVWGSGDENYDGDLSDQTGFNGNISVNPMLDGYYPICGSPVMDAGTDVDVYEDIEGNVRPLGAGFDMGCYEGCMIKQIKHPQLPSLLPMTQNHISDVDGLLKQTDDLL